MREGEMKNYALTSDARIADLQRNIEIAFNALPRDLCGWLSFKTVRKPPHNVVVEAIMSFKFSGDENGEREDD
jgi:hypothetical protein